MLNIKNITLELIKRHFYLTNMIILMCAIFLFSYNSIQLNQKEIWFSNLDQDSMLLVGAMEVNSGKIPAENEHPGLGAYYIYAKFFQLFKFINLLPISSLDQFQQSDDPLQFLPGIYSMGRAISIILSIACAIMFGTICHLLTKNILFFTTGTILYLFSGGLFFQSLVIRTELVSVLMVLISLFFLTLFSQTDRGIFSLLFMGLSGLFFGFSLFTKIQTMPFILLIVVCIISQIFSKYRHDPITFLKYRATILIIGAVFLCIYFLFIHKLYAQNIFFTFFIYLLLILFFTSIFIQPVFVRAKIPQLFIIISFFVMGFVLSTLILFYLLNFRLNPEAMKSLINGILNPYSVLDHKLSFDYKWLMASFNSYISYYSLVSYSFLFIFILFLMINPIKRKKAFFLFLFGIGYCLLNSSRNIPQSSGVSEHYLVFSDLLFCATTLLLLNYYFSDKLNGRIIALPSKFKPIVFIPILFISVAQIHFIRQSYPDYNRTFRNRIDLVPTGIYANQHYYTLLLSKYKTYQNIIERVYNDPSLNGRNIGVDLTKSLNYQIIKFTLEKMKNENNVERIIDTITYNLIRYEEFLKQKKGLSDEAHF